MFNRLLLMKKCSALSTDILMLSSFAIPLASLLALQPLAVSASTVQNVASRSFPPGLSIPNDITLWGSYSYLGCFTDSGPGRALTVLSTTTGTIEGCLSYCNSLAGYYNLAYVGLEYGHECYCDWVLQSTAVQVDDSECNMPCEGNSSQPCGGPSRLTIVSLGSSPTTAPATLNGFGNTWAYQGCYHDVQSPKVFPYRALVDIRFFTLEVCANACRVAGYPYAGIEFRNECWCGTQAQLATSSGVAPDNECGMACIYNYFERCGGSDRMSVYKLN